MTISKWPWPLTFIWPWPWVWPLTLTIWRNTFFFQFFSFSLKSRDVKTWRRTSKRMSYTESPFYKEYLSANQKSLPLPVQKLWPIMWFSLIFLKSRDVKTWRRTSKRSDTHGSGILWGTFCNQPEVSTTSGSKVMAHYLIFTKVVTLTLPVDRFFFFFVRIVLGLEDIFCQKSRTIGPAVWSVHREKTDRQTDRQMKAARRAGLLCEIRS